jgi:hypothetical protein
LFVTRASFLRKLMFGPSSYLRQEDIVRAPTRATESTNKIFFMLYVRIKALR